MNKQSVLLGLRDKVESAFKNMLDDMFMKFKNKQSLFMGHKKTYTALEEYADDPSKRSLVKVSSTVREQLDWFKKYSEDYFTTVLSIEKTNSTGIKAMLRVDGEDWGEYTVLELLRLKSIMDGKMRAMLQELPIRQESVFWKKTEDPVYEGRDVFESPEEQGFAKTTLKRTVIVSDPHIKDSPNRPPVTQPIDSQVNVGKYTSQDFSGAISNYERAKLAVKYDNVYKAIIAALEEANNTTSQTSDLGKKFLDYMFD